MSAFEASVSAILTEPYSREELTSERDRRRVERLHYEKVIGERQIDYRVRTDGIENMRQKRDP